MHLIVVISSLLATTAFALPSTVISTWAFTTATDAAWQQIHQHGASALDLVQAGCSACALIFYIMFLAEIAKGEKNRCDGTVGWGGSPDENGETTLDAMIMCGTSMNAGAVAALREIPDAVTVARAVWHHIYLVLDLRLTSGVGSYRTYDAGRKPGDRICSNGTWDEETFSSERRFKIGFCNLEK
jgi:hypothetical protein